MLKATPAAIAIVFILDTDGRIFAHRRSPKKSIFPLRYGLGAGGKLLPGERVGAAAARELAEETGIVAPAALFEELATHQPRSWLSTNKAIDWESSAGDSLKDLAWFGEFTFPHPQYRLSLFAIVVTPRALPCCSEWEWADWISRDEVEQLLTSGDLCPDTAMLWREFRGS